MLSPIRCAELITPKELPGNALTKGRTIGEDATKREIILVSFVSVVVVIVERAFRARR